MTINSRLAPNLWPIAPKECRCSFRFPVSSFGPPACSEGESVLKKNMHDLQAADLDEPLPPAGPAIHRQAPSPYDRSLNRSTVAWLEELPQSVAPVALAIQFPRIANRLSRFWDSPGMIEEYFRELLVDKRGRRKGFPKNVVAELHALAQYYRALHAKADTDVWKSIPYRRSDGR